MKKLSNTEAELKKSVAYKKKHVFTWTIHYFAIIPQIAHYLCHFIIKLCPEMYLEPFHRNAIFNSVKYKNFSVRNSSSEK